MGSGRHGIVPDVGLRNCASLETSCRWTDSTANPTAKSSLKSLIRTNERNSRDYRAANPCARGGSLGLFAGTPADIAPGIWAKMIQLSFLF